MRIELKKELRALVAALSLFTRLPFWRLMPNLNKEDYREAMSYWALVGLLTGSVLAFAYYFFLQVFTPMLAILLALALRLLMTGAFHEDGLGDCFDGFGAGGGKERILSIMKDSHIGAYAVLAYIFYVLIYTNVLAVLPTKIILQVQDGIVNLERSVLLLIPLIILGDVFSKFLATFQLYLLPYARNEETSKLKLVYKKPSPFPLILAALLILILIFSFFSWKLCLFLLIPTAVAFSLMYYAKIKIGGYTGDTCGAIFLLTELSFFLASYLYFS